MKTGIPMTMIDRWSYTPWYNQSMKNKYKEEILNTPEVKFRLKVIEFFGVYGLQTTLDAFEVSKATLYRWRKKYVDSGRNPAVLKNKSRKPKGVREPITHWKIVEYIINIREEHPRLGKEKIKPLLDEYCTQEGIKTVSISTIGNILRRKKLTSDSRVYYTALGRRKRVKKKKRRKRVRRSPKVKDLGYIEIDTIELFNNGIRRYIFNAIDIKLRFQYARCYKRKTSSNAKDFMQKLMQVYPVRKGINVVQTDNGSEYMGEFEEYLERIHIKQKFIYPRCPKVNGFVERSNRSLREECVNYIGVVDDIKYVNQKLVEYLIWYNTKRVHSGLQNKTPIDYLLNLIPESHMYVTYTSTCRLLEENI